ELKEIQRETGITFIFVTHDQEEALTMSDRIAVMSAGELQQLGSAQEIYEQPHNVFVAGFIGETNLLEVVVDSIAKGKAFCHIGMGLELSCDHIEGVDQGATVHLSIRPERLYLSDTQAEDECFAGVVRHNMFIGTDIQTIVDLPEGLSLMVRTSNSNRGSERIFDPGIPVFVNIEAGAARLLAD
ncbi:MAG: ABC transporter ATP-binding protein, partial [Granulosicoccus sp.]